jgi:hypothetical protein
MGGECSTNIGEEERVCSIRTILHMSKPADCSRKLIIMSERNGSPQSRRAIEPITSFQWNEQTEIRQISPLFAEISH